MAKEARDGEKKLHIAMFPWLAFGHMIPYLEFGKFIAQKGHKVSFISTPRNIDRLPKLLPNLSQSITFVKLPMPSIPDLPNGAEATSDLPLEQGGILKKVHDLLKDPITDLLRSLGPDWILMDFDPFWLPEIARSVGVRSSFFSIFTASCLCFIGCETEDYRRTPEDYMVAPRWINFPSPVAVRKFESQRAFESHHGNRGDDDVSAVQRIRSVLQGCDVVAVRSCWELENDYLSLLGEILRKPVVPVGQIPTEEMENSEEGDTWRDIKGWLDGQESGSVVYVAFGSEAEWSEAELAEIALGLELSSLPFFWALRARPGSEARLPEGFEGRVGRRGYVCRKWAPQVKIVAHVSVGVLLNHSGWSSVVEGLQFSKPQVLLAFSNDQGTNVKFLEERKMGFAVPRDENDGSFTRDAVAESLRMVASEEEGKIYRDKAKEVSGMFGDKEVQDKYVDEFLRLLTTHSRVNKIITIQ